MRLLEYFSVFYVCTRFNRNPPKGNY